MNKKVSTLYAVTFLLTAFNGSTDVHAACLPWDQARTVIKQNNLLTAGAARQKARRFGGRIIELRLCRSNGLYVYEVGTLVPGRVQRRVIDARNGRLVRGARPQRRKDSYDADISPRPEKLLRDVPRRFRRFVPRQLRKRYFRKRFRRR